MAWERAYNRIFRWIHIGKWVEFSFYSQDSQNTKFLHKFKTSKFLALPISSKIFPETVLFPFTHVRKNYYQQKCISKHQVKVNSTYRCQKLVISLPNQFPKAMFLICYYFLGERKVVLRIRWVSFTIITKATKLLIFLLTHVESNKIW